MSLGKKPALDLAFLLNLPNPDCQTAGRNGRILLSRLFKAFTIYDGMIDMQQPLTKRYRWLIIVGLTVISIGCALLGKWGRTISVVLIGLALAGLTSGCLRFCKARGFSQISGMLWSLALAAGYVLAILGSYDYFRG